MIEKESKCPRGVYKVKTYETLQFRLMDERLLKMRNSWNASADKGDTRISG